VLEDLLDALTSNIGESSASWLDLIIVVVGLLGGSYTVGKVQATTRLRVEARFEIYQNLFFDLFDRYFELVDDVGRINGVRQTYGEVDRLTGRIDQFLDDLSRTDLAVELLPWADRSMWSTVKSSLKTDELTGVSTGLRRRVRAAREPTTVSVRETEGAAERIAFELGDALHLWPLTKRRLKMRSLQQRIREVVRSGLLHEVGLEASERHAERVTEIITDIYLADTPPEQAVSSPELYRLFLPPLERILQDTIPQGEAIEPSLTVSFSDPALFSSIARDDVEVVKRHTERFATLLGYELRPSLVRRLKLWALKSTIAHEVVAGKFSRHDSEQNR
jgi:hypothetical protein